MSDTFERIEDLMLNYRAAIRALHFYRDARKRVRVIDRSFLAMENVLIGQVKAAEHILVEAVNAAGGELRFPDGSALSATYEYDRRKVRRPLFSWTVPSEATEWTRVESLERRR